MTYVYKTLSVSTMSDILFNDEWASWHRDSEACDALAEWLNDYASCMQEPIEFCHVALRCDYALYESIEEYNEDYDTDYKAYDDLDCHVIPVDNDGRFIASGE